MKKIGYITAIATVVVAAAFFSAVRLAQLAPVELPSVVAPAAPAPAPADIVGYPVDKASSLATSAVAEEASAVAAAPTDPAAAVASGKRPPFNAEAIFAATEKVRLDQQGQVIIDHDTMMVLQQVMAQPDLHLDELALAELKDLIAYAVAGPAGREVAEIAGNYYQFLQAKEAHEHLVREQGQAESYEDNRRQLQMLRETYLGAEVAQRLFAQADAENDFMHASMMLATDTGLTAVEREQRQQQLQQTYVTRVLQANGWTQRYQEYVQQKAALTASAGDDKAAQGDVSDLLRRHFSVEERDKMTALQIPLL